MAFEFRLPDIGEGVAEGEVVKWLVQEGADVKENQPLVEIMTDKVNVEIPSPRKGTILKLMAKEGGTVKVGEVLLVIGEKGEQGSAPTVVSPTTTTANIPAGVPAKVTAPTPSPTLVAVAPKKPQEILATPATRKLARDMGVDLGTVQGTGPGGRITDDDVRRFKDVGRSAAVAITVTGPRGVEERVPIRGIRRKVAEHMVKSRDSTAQVTHVDEVDMTEVVHLREKAKASADKQGIKLTYLPFIIKALVLALKKYPYLNASLDDEKQEIVLKKYYNIGIATDTDQGLVVPVVRAAEHKSITQLAEEISKLSEKARAGQLTLDEIQGSTFTVTNVGGIGGIFATPIINYPEVAILGVHKITKRPVVKDNQIVIRDMTYLSVSFDHRVLDGAMAAQFMNAIKQYLEDPKLLLLETD
ncbi:MAG: dihydrolipoamide acetyltransferase family protein [Candidatus Bathyarchaeia archaeon]|jgi:pyruvate dehydrogenase E2 component (dihydrolipoamide acetyltransferase)